MGSEPLGKGVTQVPKDRTYPSDTFHGVGECLSHPPLGAFPLANIHLLSFVLLSLAPGPSPPPSGAPGEQR